MWFGRAARPHPVAQVVTNFNNGEVSKVLKLYSTHAGSLDGITKPSKILDESGNGGEALSFEDSCKVMAVTEFEKKMSYFK